MQFRIENMTCGGCVRSVTKAIHAVDPAAGVSADPDTRQVTVTTQVPRAQLVAALTDVGYAPA